MHMTKNGTIWHLHALSYYWAAWICLYTIALCIAFHKMQVWVLLLWSASLMMGWCVCKSDGNNFGAIHADARAHLYFPGCWFGLPYHGVRTGVVALFWRDKSFLSRIYIHMVHSIPCILLTSSVQGLGRAFAVRLLEAGAKWESQHFISLFFCRSTGPTFNWSTWTVGNTGEWVLFINQFIQSHSNFLYIQIVQSFNLPSTGCVCVSPTWKRTWIWQHWRSSGEGLERKR